MNNNISPNLNLKVGDQLKFILSTSVPNHPLTICKNSPLPTFCQGSSATNTLNSPITQLGSTTSVTFTVAGTFYYGCHNHPGMGAKINVVR